MKLSPQQQDIIQHKRGIGLVTAGPGTGKTQTIISAINNYLKQGVNPKHILVLTYSKSTQLDFVNRLHEVVGNQAYYVKVYTTHGFGLSIIHQYANQFESLPEFNPEPDQPTHNAEFNKMLEYPLQLFHDYPKILKQLPYTHLFVDEVQDVSQKQAELFVTLAKSIKTTLLVGDQKQSIYGFLGAGTKQWNYLVKQLNPKRYELTQTFRLPKQSLPFINAFASTFSDDPPLTSEHKGYKPWLFKFDSISEQAEYIANEILRLQSKGIVLSDIAILSRTRNPLQQLQLALNANHIDAVEDDYSVIEPWLPLFRSMVYLTKWTLNTICGKALSKCLNRVFDLAEIPAKKHPTLLKNITSHGISALKIKKNNVQQGPYNRVKNMQKAIINATKQSDPEAGIQLLIDSLLPFIRNETSPKVLKRVQQYLSRIKVQLRGVQWKQITPEMLRPITKESGVTLTTIHGAKSKEWKVVFLINLVEGELPITFTKKSAIKLYEERSMFYTAITRHRERLYLLQTTFNRASFPKGKGKVNNSYQKQSSFITPHLNLLCKGNPYRVY